MQNAGMSDDGSMRDGQRNLRAWEEREEEV